MYQVNALTIDVPRNLGRSWRWFLALGIGLGVLGVLGIVHATSTTVASMEFYGELLVAAAAIEAMNAAMVGKWTGFFLHLLGVLLFAVTGFLLLRYPSTGLEDITELMAAYFIIGGSFEVVAPPFVGLPDAAWHVLNGVISIFLGIMVVEQWPVSGLWAIGMFIGIDLVARGITWMVFAFGLREIRKDSVPEIRPGF